MTEQNERSQVAMAFGEDSERAEVESERGNWVSNYTGIFGEGDTLRPGQSLYWTWTAPGNLVRSGWNMLQLFVGTASADNLELWTQVNDSKPLRRLTVDHDPIHLFTLTAKLNANEFTAGKANKITVSVKGKGGWVQVGYGMVHYRETI